MTPQETFIEMLCKGCTNPRPAGFWYCEDCAYRRMLARIADKIVVTDAGCWQHTSPQVTGYAQVGDGRRRVRPAHRVVYEHFNGPVPAELTIDHLCRNRACVNPAHMEPVTSRENSLRGESCAAQNARKDRCVNGHRFTPENTYFRPLGRGRKSGRVCRACGRDRANAKNAAGRGA